MTTGGKKGRDGIRPTDAEVDPKLDYSEPFRTGVHGFYKTEPGRKLLREIARKLPQKGEFGTRTLPRKIADTNATFQKRENELTRGAYRRWLDGSANLWTDDPEKSRRVLRRFEAKMMAVADYANVLNDHAANIHKDDAGNGMALFFYGRRNNRYEFQKIVQLQIEIEGLYHQIRYSVNGRDSNASVTAIYHYFHRISNKPYMVAHEFTLKSIGPNRTGIFLGDRRSGFAYPLANGDIHRLMVNYENPGERTYDVLKRYAADEVPYVIGTFGQSEYTEVNRQMLDGAVIGSNAAIDRLRWGDERIYLIVADENSSIIVTPLVKNILLDLIL